MKTLTVPLHIDQDLQTMLNFYHDLGRIIYFGSLSKDRAALADMVILNPQWLVDVFKQVITIADAKHIQTMVSVSTFSPFFQLLILMSSS